LVVAASEGVMEQTKEHIWLSKTLGVGQFSVAVNKMDSINYDESKFNKVKEEVSAVLKTVGYNPEAIPFVPISALQGDNITKNSDKMQWYKGPCLLDMMNGFKEPEKPVNLPLRLPIQDVYNITGIGVVPVGRVETGIMKIGDKVTIVPAREGTGVSGEVKTIEMHHEQIQQAEPGDNIGFSVRGIGKKDIARGDVLGHASEVPTLAKEFTAQIVVLNHPTVITVGYTPVFHIHTAQVACKFVELVKKIDPASGQVIAENPDMLKTGDAAIVKIQPSKPLVIEKQSEIPQMARFAIRDAGRTVAAGMCTDLVKKKFFTFIFLFLKFFEA
jgi:elongation factor 1-alpha